MLSLRVFLTGRPLARAVPALVLAAMCGLSSCVGFPDMLERARTQEDTNDEPPPTDPVPEGDTPVPLDDGKAWIQLKSGEWLRGELIRIRDDQVDFDSDELDDQTFDLEDVKQIRSPREGLIVTNDNRVFGGGLVMDGDKVWIIGGRTVQISRGEMLSALSVGENHESRWFVDLTLGSTVRSGNTDQIDYTGGAEVLRETARTRASGSYIGAVSSISSIETTNNHRVGLAYDVFLTKRLFVTVPGLDLYSDRIQNIQLRAAAYAAVGYQFVDTPNHTWDVSIGPAYQLTRQNTVEAGVDPTSATGAFQASSSYEWEITKDIDFDFDYTITVPTPETDEYNHNLILSFEFELTKKLDLDIKFIWDRVNMPIAGEDSVTPLPDDYRSTIGLTYKF